MILGLPDPPPQTISDWLQTATRGLADASKKRIRPEIEAHYTEAVEVHGKNGLTESEAQKAALTELGDARAAGKRFRRQYLTEWEADWLKKLEKGPRSNWNIIWVLFIGCFALWLYTTDLLPFRRDALAHFHSVPLYFTIALLVWVGLPAACCIVARYSNANRIRSVLFMLALNWFAGWAFFSFTRIHEMADVVPFLAGVIVASYLPLRLWFKLSKARAKNLGQAS